MVGSWKDVVGFLGSAKTNVSKIHHYFDKGPSLIFEKSAVTVFGPFFPLFSLHLELAFMLISSVCSFVKRPRRPDEEARCLEPQTVRQKRRQPPSTHLGIYQSIHLSIYPPIHLSSYPSIHVSTYPPIHLSIYPYLSISISLQISSLRKISICNYVPAIFLLTTHIECSTIAGWWFHFFLNIFPLLGEMIQFD